MIYVNVNNGQDKFEVHILKNVAIMTNHLPKMSQDATFAQSLNGHNSVISHPILTFDHIKMISSFTFRFFWPFLLQNLIWETLGAWTKNLPHDIGTCPGHHLQLIARNHFFEIFRGEPPL